VKPIRVVKTPPIRDRSMSDEEFFINRAVISGWRSGKVVCFLRTLRKWRTESRVSGH
jgi:hypothetical protein